jgi:hypothetical protein
LDYALRLDANGVITIFILADCLAEMRSGNDDRSLLKDGCAYDCVDRLNEREKRHPIPAEQAKMEGHFARFGFVVAKFMPYGL